MPFRKNYPFLATMIRIKSLKCKSDKQKSLTLVKYIRLESEEARFETSFTVCVTSITQTFLSRRAVKIKGNNGASSLSGDRLNETYEDHSYKRLRQNLPKNIVKT